MAENIQINIDANTSGLDRAKKSINSASYALNDLSRIAQDAPYGFIGISNNINPLVESFGRLRAESTSNVDALKKMLASLTGPAGVGLAFGLLSAAISFASVGLSRWIQTSEKAKAAIDEQKKALDSIYTSEAKEATQVSTMIAVLNNENETRNRKLEAIKKLQAINPEVFKGLKLENDTVVGLTAAYDAYIKNIEKSVRVKIIQQRLEEVYAKLIKTNGAALTESEKAISDGLANITKNRANDLKSLGDQGAAAAAKLMNVSESLSRKKQNDINSYTQQITELTAKLSELSSGIDLPVFNEKIKKVKQAIEDFNTKFVNIKVLKVDKVEVPELKKQTLGIKVPIIPIIDIPFIKSQETNYADGINKLFGNLGGYAADAFTMAFESGSGVKGFFDGLFQAFGQGMIELGKYFITTALVIQKIKEAIIKDTTTAIVAAVGLIAIGTGIKQIYSKKAFATGTTNAPGGMSLVGERGPELVNLPRGSQVIPNGRTSAMLGGMSNGVEVYGVLRGQDIYFSNKKYAQTYNRTT